MTEPAALFAHSRVRPGRRDHPARRHRPGRQHAHRGFRWMLAPATLFVLVMIGFPVLDTLWLSHFSFHFGSAAHPIGLGNYATLLHDRQFWNSLEITFLLYVLALALQLVSGLYLALLLNRARRLRRLLRTLLVSPFVMPGVVVGMMFLVIFDPTIGLANWLLSLFGIPPALWLASPTWVIPTVALIDTWQWAPFVALILLAGLQSLPSDVYEAAAIDGASGFSLLRRITLPLLAPSLLVAAILRSVDLLRFFDVIYVTTEGGPGNASDTLNIYAFRQGFVFLNIGYASALMVALTAVVIVVVIALTRLRRITAW
ncbi:MAG: sugar ABC transporter permease [Rhodospirillales bacterium]|nr:sugar ABC transporter permease [Rhodospirillales bacterium]